MKRIILSIIFLTIALIGYLYGYPLYKLHFATVLNNDDKIVYISTGTTLNELAEQLASEGVIDTESFLSYASKLDFDEVKIEPGKYMITGNMKIKNLIYGLKNGNQEIKDVKITFNNCKTIYDIAGKVAPYIEADSIEIADYIMSPKTLEKYGFKTETIPALFLPDTYEVGEWDMNAEEFVAFMAKQWNIFWNEERTQKRNDLKLSESEIATLASIIEAEQGIHTQEWTTIAGLYLNRVRKGMKLEADPTFKFCWGNELDGVQRLLDIHRKKDCPYNTYIYPGIPPGPIRVPSKKAIDAVLNAEKHNYLFFCARPDNSGLHAFAETFQQHLENARKFWKYMDQRNN